MEERGYGPPVGVQVFSHLEIWAPNMFPAKAEPLPPAAFQLHPIPPKRPAFLLDPTPRLRGGSGVRCSGMPGESGFARAVPRACGAIDVGSSDGSGSHGDGGGKGGGGKVRIACLGRLPLPSVLAPTPQRSKFQGRRWERGALGCRPLSARSLGFGRGKGPLEWWVVPCIYGRAMLALVTVGAAAERRRPDASRGHAAGTIGVARAGTGACPPVKRQQHGAESTQIARTPPSSLADLARVALRTMGLIRPPS